MTTTTTNTTTAKRPPSAFTARATVRPGGIPLPAPHSPWQREMVFTPLSMVMLAGARAGKTEGEVKRMLRCMTTEPGLYYWVGLSWPSASLKKAWRLCKGHCTDLLRAKGLTPKEWINLSSHEIRLPNGSTLMFRTAENPGSIAGDGPRGIVGDEFTYWDEEVWTRFVQPSMADPNASGKPAWCHLIGRPNGSNWGYDLWQAAASRPGWLQRHKTIYDNPLIDRALIEDLRANTPAPMWDQEYMALPESGGGGGIPRANVLAAMARWKAMTPAERKAGRPLVLGIDVAEGGAGDRVPIAMRYGWTVDQIIDATPTEQGDMMPIADIARLNMMGEPRSYAIVDTVGVGAMLPSAIRRFGGRVVGYKASETTKLRDKTGEFGFVNIDAAAWWHLGELLAPDGPGIALPDSPTLLAQLTGRRFQIRAGAKIGLEDKATVKARLGRSPDDADACVMSFWDRAIMKGRDG